jgi:hypothetical protein
MNLARTGLPENVRKDLEFIGSHGIAKGTWSSYNTAVKMLRKCSEENGMPLDWPVKEKTILMFIHWLLKVRRVGASTIEVYLSGIRTAHIAQGLPAPTVRSELINLIIKGKRNMQATESRKVGKIERQPITPDILALLKARLRVWEAPEEDRRLVWTVATVCFHGGFRMGELLCRSENVFDPQYVLLARDADIDAAYRGNQCKGVLRLRLKSPKEDKLNRSLIVDVFGNGGKLCPVRAFVSWEKLSEKELDQPLFRLSNGKPLTARKFTYIVRGQLRGYLEGVDLYISAHSFRIGLASMLAALGYSEDDIKAMGRWSSRAWLEYVKHPRTLRIAVAQTIGL